MGRKPNQIVLEYFDRGIKLEDNSNRYEHRCKACGKHFPKGRIESLINHVEKKCLNIRREQHVPGLASNRVSSHGTSVVNEDDATNAFNHFNGHTISDHQLILPGRSLTGLEALAEASRQLEHPGKPDANSPSQNQLIDPDLERASSFFRHSGFTPGLGENAHYPTTDTDGSHDVPGVPSSGPYLLSGHPYAGSQASDDPAILSLAALTHLERTNPTKIATRPGTAPSDEADSSPLLQPLSTNSTPDDAPSFSNRSSEKPLGRAQKVRGRFTDLRRQEVQNIRKKGACIRCRMLRKTTCASVLSARVWKLDCVRTNIYKELEIFHAGTSHDSGPLTMGPRAPGLLEILSSRLLERRKSSGVSESDRCSIRVGLSRSDASPMSFSARAYKLENAEITESRQAEEGRTFFLLDEQMEQLSAKLLPYMQATVSLAQYTELDGLVGPTMRLSSRLKQEGNDRLLVQTLDLWALTQVMVSNPDDWHFFPNSSNTNPEEQGQPSTHMEVYEDGRSLSKSFDCVLGQLQAAAEHRASTISRAIMVDLERRLERKERCQGFETFLVGILLLNCVERMCWVSQCISESSEGQDWPLANPVEYYLNQAARFAEFISKLYKMRGLLVNVRQEPDNDILHTNATTAPLADKWLNELRLTSSALKERREARLFDSSNHRKWLGWLVLYDEDDLDTSIRKLISLVELHISTHVPVVEAGDWAKYTSLYLARAPAGKSPTSQTAIVGRSFIPIPCKHSHITSFLYSGLYHVNFHDAIQKTMRLISKSLRTQWPQIGKRCWLARPPFPRSFHTTAPLAVIKPILLTDIGEGIKEVQIIQWFVEPEARVEEFDKLCEVQSDKAATEISSRFSGVIKKLHYEAEDMAQVGKPLCDIDVLSEIAPEGEAALGSTPEQAGSPSTPQQPQKAAQPQHDQSAESQGGTIPAPGRYHASLATPAVRGLLKDLNIDIFEITGTGKDGRVLKEDVHNHVSSRSAPSASTTQPPSNPTTSSPTQTETPVTLTPIQSQMFKTMTRSLSIPHFLYADELDITALSRLRSHLNQTPHPSNQTPKPKLSYLPFIIKT
ncbi:MAG: hypothetical protein Q9170_005810, partial [Blastenia crenularia]